MSGTALLLSSLELRDTQVYEPYIRALLATAGTSWREINVHDSVLRCVGIGAGAVGIRSWG